MQHKNYNLSAICKYKNCKNTPIVYEFEFSKLRYLCGYHMNINQLSLLEATGELNGGDVATQISPPAKA